MRKLKFSFAFVLMLFLVGMYSAVAFAAGESNPVSGSYTPGIVDGSTGSATGTGVVDDLATDDAGRDNGLNNDNNSGSGVGGQTANFSQVIKSQGMVSVDANGNVVQTMTQRTHGSYQNNTNSCASCHQTHTGAGASLLFKDGEYATCTACHDGTLGFYNVMGKGSNSAGTFGGTHDGNMSAHLANGTVKIAAAPGGNHNPGDKEAAWNAEFSCASCHAPHGSFSDRLLHPDPNGMADVTLDKGGQKLVNVPVLTLDNTSPDLVSYQAGGEFTVKNPMADETTANYIVYRFAVNDKTSTINDYSALTTGDTVLQVMQWNGTKYVADTKPWLHEYEFDAAHNKIYYTRFTNGTTNSKGLVYGFDTDKLKDGEILGRGYAAVTSGSTLVSTVNGLVKGDVARAYTVKLNISALDANNVGTTTVSTLWNSSDSKYKSGNGVLMSSFCASCHTDYLAKSGSETGTFSHAYRHTTNSDTYTCVRCHFAHGTDVSIMRDARGLTYDEIKADTTDYPFSGFVGTRDDAVKAYLMDKNPSSALKRYTNMAVCWGCHTSSHSGGTRNTDTYKYNPTPGVNTDRNGMTEY